jgi:hypothetical protein
MPGAPHLPGGETHGDRPDGAQRDKTRREEHGRRDEGSAARTERYGRPEDHADEQRDDCQKDPSYDDHEAQKSSPRCAIDEYAAYIVPTRQRSERDRKEGGPDEQADPEDGTNHPRAHNLDEDDAAAGHEDSREQLGSNRAQRR